ncbi:MAG: non-canonical purine NTP pyrophosphatase [Actinobacteria bacterium 69-20]|nr:non-canonical purine NTP pyrophosphatase [Actinomycetota bacterium]OJV27126.1 MAG: non-canonical purine NTP pyrophosphatase [Actinobacteria bacterium 69-20]
MTPSSGSGPRLLLASANRGKLAELRRLVPPEVAVLGLGDVPPYSPLPESGATFEDNALIKARQAAQESGILALADDSGLEVDALNGMPGVLSARWCGRHGDDAANNALLLGQLADVPDARRGAAFVSAVALVDPAGRAEVVRGRWPGRLIRESRGSNGFGYDPLFVPAESDADGTGRTSAELAPERKNELSHRARAMAAILPAVLSRLGLCR